MRNIRLLPVVILAVAALLVLKTIGLVTHGGYVLTGVAVAEAAGGGSGAAPAVEPGETITLPGEPTVADGAPTISETTPTLGEEADEDHSAPVKADAPDGAEEPAGQEAAAGAEVSVANSVEAANECGPRRTLPDGEIAGEDGELMVIAAGCPPLADAIPKLVTPDGSTPLNGGNETLTEQALLERLSSRRSELETYEQELAMRASLVEAAERRIEERQQTLQSIEDQIASLVEQRKEMEEGQFAGIVAMYETMKPKDAANIFNALDIEVLLKVAKIMSPRKMSPILAEMATGRAQELTVRMASASQDPLESMAPDDLAALPQIVGQ